MADNSLSSCCKICSQCKSLKSVLEFYKNRTKQDGLQSICKSCTKENDISRVLSGTNKIRCKTRLKYPKTDADRERRRRHKAANREKYRIYDRIRIAKKRSSGGTFTLQEIRNLHDRQRGKCAFCKTSLKNGYHIDHIVPVALNGGNGIENIQLLCPKCNWNKGCKCPFEWANENGRLL